jgi:uncharacterized membrane protein
MSAPIADLHSPNTVNALIHLYRAEVGKMTAYRVRLDTTTNWAISSSALVSTFALSNPQVPHAAFLFLMALVYFFLHLEARRFRAYEGSRYRVLLMERYFFPAMLSDAVDPHWTRHLLTALDNPGLTVNMIGAIGWRVRRNYFWIYGILLITWLSKVDLSYGPIPDLGAFVQLLEVGSVPGPVVLGLVAAFYLYLLVIGLGAVRVYPLGDEDSRIVMEAVTDS